MILTLLLDANLSGMWNPSDVTETSHICRVMLNEARSISKGWSCAVKILHKAEKNKKLTNHVTISSPSTKLRSKFRINFGTVADAALD